MSATTDEGFVNFSLNLYREVCSTLENAVVSPAAVALALFSAYFGCREAAHTQIQDVLLGAKATERDAVSRATELGKVTDSGVVSSALRIANRIYCQNGFVVLDAFKQQVATTCGCDVISVDFGSSPTLSDDVNRWASEITNGKLVQVVTTDTFKASCRIAIVSVASFNGRWQNEFPSSNTTKRTFYRSADSAVKVYMMNHQMQCMYGEDDTCQVVQLGYTDKLISMFLFLPKDRFGLKQFQTNLTGAKFLCLVNSVRRRDVKVSVPRFDLENDFSLKRSLLKMKITDIFNPDLAEFTYMAKSNGLCVSSAIHKAVIEVSERGCETAAAGFPSTATSLYMEKPKEFIADHPFLFAVTGGKHKNILFIGRFTGSLDAGSKHMNKYS